MPLTLLHSERPNLHRGLAFLRAIRLYRDLLSFGKQQVEDKLVMAQKNWKRDPSKKERTFKFEKSGLGFTESIHLMEE